MMFLFIASSSCVGWQTTLQVLYCHYGTLALFLVSRPVTLIIIIPVQSFLTCFSCALFLPLPRQVCSFRLGVSVIWVLFKSPTTSQCGRLLPVWTHMMRSGWVFQCLWSDFCLTFTTETPQRAEIKSNKFLIYPPLFVTLIADLLPRFWCV